jgi:RNA polymerase sigma-70 factor (ECF subfamily)
LPIDLHRAAIGFRAEGPPPSAVLPGKCRTPPSFAKKMQPSVASVQQPAQNVLNPRLAVIRRGWYKTARNPKRFRGLPFMPTDDSFADIMGRLRTGDEDAAAQVVRRFTHRLIALARNQLDSRVRQKVDPEDVLQSVYKSFFARHAQGQLSFAGWDGLWALLALITVRKCGRCARWFHRAQRDVHAEVAVAAGPDESDVIQMFSDEPSPQEAAMLSEVVEQLLRALGQRDGEILTLALLGYSAAEISDRLGRPGRTVYRVLERIKVRLQESPPDASSARLSYCIQPFHCHK